MKIERNSIWTHKKNKRAARVLTIGEHSDLIWYRYTKAKPSPRNNGKLVPHVKTSAMRRDRFLLMFTPGLKVSAKESE